MPVVLAGAAEGAWTVTLAAAMDHAESALESMRDLALTPEESRLFEALAILQYEVSVASCMDLMAAQGNPHMDAEVARVLKERAGRSVARGPDETNAKWVQRMRGGGA